MSLVVKGDGTREVFEIQKLIHSLQRSHAAPETINRIAEKIALTVQDGMTTTEIYQNAFKALYREERLLAARYSLRRALLDMGPTGFPFEDYFAELMRAVGYEVKTRQIIPGRCVPHEVDSLLMKDGKTIGAELKFHNIPGLKTDIRTALYVRARFLDIQEAAVGAAPCPMDEMWLVTNTKFTEHVLVYAPCVGIRLLGWSYPEERNIASLIEETGLYPITVLTSLSKKEKGQLLMQQVTLCRDLRTSPHLLSKAGIPKRKHAAIISESTELCNATL